MRRVGNIYEQICSVENLQLADEKGRKGKKKQKSIIEHDENREANILALHHLLVSKTYRTSAYKTFKIREPKERVIFRLPYYPDRIVHHAIMNVLEPLFVGVFTKDTYSCIKRRGIHGCAKALRRALKDVDGTTYCLKLDIRKFYPTIDHDILKALLRRKIKDPHLLWLLDEIIDSAEGLPIGNYLSQYLANFYLSAFDHWIKERKGVKYYFRYADDIVILFSSKEYLHELLADIRLYLWCELRLSVKDNYQIFSVKVRGIDFLGYVFYHTHVLLRKGIKKRFARMLARNRNPLSIASYRGWAKHCNSFNLLKKLLVKEFKDLNIDKSGHEKLSRLVGEKIGMKKILNKRIAIYDYQIRDSTKFAGSKCLHLQIELNGEKRVVFTSGKKLMLDIQKIEKVDFPFATTIVELETNYLEFK